MVGRTGDDVLLPSHDVYDPSPFYDDSSHAVLVASGKMFKTGDNFRPEYSQYSEVSDMDSREFN